MRVVGELGGRPLRAPSGAGTRPTSDMLRGALFAALEARGEAWGHSGPAGLRVLDLYAGSGALGIEALSRGAEEACFVEIDRQALATLRANLLGLGLRGRSRVFAEPVRPFLARRRRSGEPFGLVLADPPYALGAAHLLPLLQGGGWLTSGGLCALEHTAREELPEQSGTLSRLWQRVHGGTALTIYAAQPDGG